MKKELPEYCLPVERVFPPVGGMKKGEIGIEIEAEGENLPQKLTSYWSVHEEGSLRGESAEYALFKPVSRKACPNILKYLKKALTKNKARVDESSRTSVHVHLNVQGMTLKQVLTLTVLYVIFEDVLVRYAGESRVGNVFCLRSKDAEHFLDALVDAVKTNTYECFTREDIIRYSSINICSVWKFNSVEFRALRGTVDPKLIWEWTRILLAVKDASLRYSDPRAILADYSGLGPRRFLNKTFGPLAEVLECPSLEAKVQESVWLVQELVYCSSWEEPEKIPKPRMFERHVYPEPKIKPALANPRQRGPKAPPPARRLGDGNFNIRLNLNEAPAFHGDDDE